MHVLIINEDGVDHTYECANGFVSRCVSAVHAENFSDARRICAILNREAADRELFAKVADNTYDQGPENPYSYDGGATSVGWNAACIAIAEKIREGCRPSIGYDEAED